MTSVEKSLFELVQNPLRGSEPGASASDVVATDGYVDPCPHGRKGESSVAGASANLVNCIVGAGIIGLPAAVKSCGFFSGGLCLVAVACLLCQSAIYLVHCGERESKHNFESLAEHLMGPAGYYVTTCCMAVFAYGGMTAYMVILGDTLPPVVSLGVADAVFSSREFLVLLCATVVMLPICMLKSLSDMVWASTLSVLADAALILIVLIEGPAEARAQGIETNSSHLTFMMPGIFAGIGTMSFAFVCHHNSFIIYKSLREPTQQNWYMVTHYSAGVALLFALTLGLGGYLIFNERVQGDVLNNFESSGSAVVSGKLLLALCMVLTYPVECFIARHCVNSMIDYYRSRPYGSINESGSSTKSDVNEEDIERGVEAPVCQESEVDQVIKFDAISTEVDSGGDEGAGEGPDGSSQLTLINVVLRGDRSLFRSDLWHAAVTLLLWGSSTLLSLVFTDLGVVLSFTGCIAASMLGYILPGTIYLLSYKMELMAALETWSPTSNIFERSLSKRMLSLRAFLLPVGLVAFGASVLVIGITTVLFLAANGEQAE